jgi:hypothetical protein
MRLLYDLFEGHAERKMKRRILNMVVPFAFLCTLLAAAFTQPENPSWVNELIARFKAESVGNPPQSIYRYEYKNRTVYYVPPQCCDQFSTLYDAEGKVLCAPDGGLTGRGDGRCTDFDKERKSEHLIWKDSRGK